MRSPDGQHPCRLRCGTHHAHDDGEIGCRALFAPLRADGPDRWVGWLAPDGTLLGRDGWPGTPGTREQKAREHAMINMWL